jgi:hypothetical protein
MHGRFFVCRNLFKRSHISQRARKMKTKRWVVLVFGISTLLALLLFLAACGGSADEAVQDTGDVNTEAVEDSAESEAIADDVPSATGSEDDSGEFPPTPETGSKVSPTRVSPSPTFCGGSTAVATAPPTNRTTAETAQHQQPNRFGPGDRRDRQHGPELSQLQAGLAAVAIRLSTLPGTPTLRYGLVLYRDLDNGESTQLFNLTDNWALFAENLTTVTAVWWRRLSRRRQQWLLPGRDQHELAAGCHQTYDSFGRRPAPFSQRCLPLSRRNGCHGHRTQHHHLHHRQQRPG